MQNAHSNQWAFLFYTINVWFLLLFFWFFFGGVYNKLRENIKLMQPVIAYFKTVIWKFEQQLGNKFHNNPKSNLAHTSPKSPPPPPYPKKKKHIVDIYIVDNNSIYRLDLAAGKSSIRIISIFITNSHTVWLSQWLELENLCIEI